MQATTELKEFACRLGSPVARRSRPALIGFAYPPLALISQTHLQLYRTFVRGRSGHGKAKPQPGRSSALATGTGAYERVCFNFPQYSCSTSIFSYSIYHKATLFRAFGPEQSGFGVVSWHLKFPTDWGC